jgi:hypothetical protein
VPLKTQRSPVDSSITPSPDPGGYQGNPVSSAVNVVCGSDVVTEVTTPTIVTEVPVSP